jgi:type I restriction enzyme S subunit
MSATWTTATLKQVCSISSALVDPRLPEYQSLPHVGGANIKSVTGELVTVKVAEDEGLKSGKFTFDERMVLYSKIRPYLRKVALQEFEWVAITESG